MKNTLHLLCCCLIKTCRKTDTTGKRHEKNRVSMNKNNKTWHLLFLHVVGCLASWVVICELERPTMDVPCVYRVQWAYRLADGAFLPRLFAVEVLPKNITLKWKWLKKKRMLCNFRADNFGMQKTRKKTKRQMNFLTPTKFKKKNQFYRIWL